MMDHIAVVLRGHIRTWSYTHSTIFRFYKSIAKNVDYYFVTWDTPGVDEQRIRKTFKGQHLEKFLVVPYNSDLYNSWLGPSWLCNNVLPFKHEREKTVKYNAVFDTRPDVIYRLVNKRFIRPEPKCVYTSEIDFFTSALTEKTTVGIGDWFLYSDSNTFDKMTERYMCLDQHSCQIQFRIEIEKYNFSLCVSDSIQTAIVRPNAIDRIPNPDKFFNHNRYQLAEDWVQLTAKEKSKILEKHHINEVDYQTISLNSKL
jgi:hypothetical protein